MSVRIDRRQSGCRLRDIRILEALLKQRGIYDRFSCIEDILNPERNGGNYGQSPDLIFTRIMTDKWLKEKREKFITP